MRLFFCCTILALCLASSAIQVFGQDDIEDLFDDGPINVEIDSADLPPEIGEAVERKKIEAKKKSEDEQKEKKDGLSEEEQQTLDDFFKELEDIVDGSGKRAKAISEIKDELQAEYRENELTLKDIPTNSALLDRQKLIAQYYMDLKTRSTESDPRKMHERLSLVSNRVRDFRKTHPILARLEDFRTRERAIRNAAMQRGAFGGIGFDRNTSLLTTMKSLSATGVAHDIWAPKILRAHPGETKGELQEHAFTMRRLLRLRWDGEQLSLDKNHWNNAFAGQTPQAITKDVDHLLEERGLKPIVNDQENRNRQRMMNGMVPGMDDSSMSNLGRIFQELYSTDRGFSGGGGFGRWNAHSELFSASLTATAANFRFSFSEASSPNRNVVLTSRDGSLRIVVLGDFIHRFAQQSNEDGTTVQVTEILDGDVINHRAETFAELYRTQPRFVEDRFFPLLEHCGIVPPLSRFDTKIAERVCELLEGNRQEVKKRFDAIAANLDVNQFTKRDAAYRELRANLDEFFPFIYESSKDRTLSIETRARIGKLLELGNQKGTAELDSMIAALGLTSDSGYLSELIEVASADARPILKAQIDSLE